MLNYISHICKLLTYEINSLQVLVLTSHSKLRQRLSYSYQLYSLQLGILLKTDRQIYDLFIKFSIYAYHTAHYFLHRY